MPSSESRFVLLARRPPHLLYAGHLTRVMALELIEILDSLGWGPNYTLYPMNYRAAGDVVPPWNLAQPDELLDPIRIP